MSTIRYEATLVRGMSYFVRGKKFLRGVPQEIDGDLKLYLEENAFDDVTVETRPERRQKFTFKAVSPAEAPVRRGRPPKPRDEDGPKDDADADGS